MAVAGMGCGAALGQFEMQDSTTTADLRGVVSVGNGTAWASGTRGTVLRTEDSGFVWQGCAMPPGAERLDFRGIQAFDDQTAIVMSSGKGDLSRVYKTTDGCLTWKLVFTNPDVEGFFDAIQMQDRLHGWLLGDPVTVGSNKRFALIRTEDGGRTWQAAFRNQPQVRSYGDEAVFAASNSSLAVRGDRLTLVTGNGARAFYVFTGPYACTCGGEPPKPGEWLGSFGNLPFGPGASAGGFSVALNETHEVVVGGDYSKPEESRATAAFGPAGGQVEAATLPPHGYRSAVAYDVPSKTWITVGPNGTDVSTDDGRNWKALRPGEGDAADADRNWNALSLPFVVGPHGRIGRLRDGVLSGAGK